MLKIPTKTRLSSLKCFYWLPDKKYSSSQEAEECHVSNRNASKQLEFQTANPKEYEIIDDKQQNLLALNNKQIGENHNICMFFPQMEKG